MKAPLAEELSPMIDASADASKEKLRENDLQKASVDGMELQPQDGGPLDGMGKEALFALANEEAEAAEDGMRQAVVHAISSGEALAAAKAQCPHGQWLDWLAEHWGYTRRLASCYIRIAGSSCSLGDATSVRDALRLISAKEREANGKRASHLDDHSPEPTPEPEPNTNCSSHLDEDPADNETEAEWELIDSEPADTPAVVESWKSSSNRLGDLKAIIDELEPHEVEVLKGWLDVPAKPKIRKSGYSDAFERFWDMFPGVRKTKKKDAYKSWKRALADDVDPEYIIQAATEFADSPEGMGRFCPGPLPWLNGRRWEDDRSAWLNGGDSDDPNDVTRRTLAKFIATDNQQAIEGPQW